METYYRNFKIAATVAVFSQGMYYSIVQPGPMDFFSALVGALVVYAIWFAKERTK